MYKNKLFIGILLVSIAVVAAGCGVGSSDSGMKHVAQTKADGDILVSILHPEGKLKNGAQEIGLRFTDPEGNPVDISAASLNFHMPAMGSMAEMNDSAMLNTTSTPGMFKGKVDLQMAGDWIAQVSFEGKETGKTTMKVTAY